MTERIIEVEIAGVLTPVDADDWATNPEAATALVLKNRLELQLNDVDTAAEAQAHLDRAEPSS